LERLRYSSVFLTANVLKDSRELNNESRDRVGGFPRGTARTRSSCIT